MPKRVRAEFQYKTINDYPEIYAGHKEKNSINFVSITCESRLLQVGFSFGDFGTLKFFFSD